MLLLNTYVSSCYPIFSLFFLYDTAPTEIYTLSLHDALPIYLAALDHGLPVDLGLDNLSLWLIDEDFRNPSSIDRKSTRLNSSHGYISYAVFCLKKKKKTRIKTLFPVIKN